MTHDRSSAAPMRARPWPAVRVALAPLAWPCSAAVDAAVRRPSSSSPPPCCCLPAQRRCRTSASGRVTVADLAAGLAVVAVVAVRLLAGDRGPARRRGWLPFAAVLVALAVATVTAPDVGRERARLRPLHRAVRAGAGRRRDVACGTGSTCCWSPARSSPPPSSRARSASTSTLTGTGASYAGRVRAGGRHVRRRAGARAGRADRVRHRRHARARPGRCAGRARIVLLATAALPGAAARRSRSAAAPGSPPRCAVAGHARRLQLAGRASCSLARSASPFSCWLAAPRRPGLGHVRPSGSPASCPRAARRTGRCKDRYALWGAAVGIWADHPVVGVGPEGLRRSTATRTRRCRCRPAATSDDPTAGFRREPLLSAHNQYLMVLSEQGMVGDPRVRRPAAGARRRRGAPPPAGRRRAVRAGGAVPRPRRARRHGLDARSTSRTATSAPARPACVLAVLLGLVARRTRHRSAVAGDAS